MYIFIRYKKKMSNNERLLDIPFEYLTEITKYLNVKFRRETGLSVRSPLFIILNKNNSHMYSSSYFQL